MRRFAIILGSLALFVVAAFIVIIQPGTSGVVASMQLPDGSQYMVTQRCNWNLEPYTVAFYMRHPGGNWGWCYIDHQASRWSNVAMTYDTNKDVVTVTERGMWRASLDRKRVTFAISHAMREVEAPQSYREPEFPFPR
jgi:hypothetical protein